jgi:hypothetical protein
MAVILLDRQMYTAEPSLPERGSFDVEIVNEKLKEI